ncbi:TVP38/TMEM64 family membrane protein slr0305 [Babesia microti strain RI]|uniref:TVP38/TMEM64 family membrane protein slr0305 n=1 Tax=Babesia microti (strain RI) TaxID=1133968 RepID=A0A1R4ABL9_BABMR|nr:TVP38/TMEM64 family membrane protein slr0305 [Babesia microti strain RI]SJK86334.1 TVP38/TMEM64 family membrane protein slr0305 [Babesia microti strain RI]|eukprot:XP_021338504.1 TVP38/TMEM64 family membrane protein slr0305 [Babesia microti strain RI]
MSSGFVFSKIYGKLWGILFASLSSFVGYLIGSSICFIISKYLLYNGVKRIFCSNKYYNSINRTADNMGLRVVAMLRISPLLPHAMISYILGTTDVTFFCFSVGNFAAYPGIFVLSYIGSILGYVVTDMSFFLNAESVILTILGISLSAAGIIYTYNLVKNNIQV